MNKIDQFCKNRRFALFFMLASLLAMPSRAPAGMNLAQSPLFLTQSQPPLVMLTMARDEKLYYQAYDDYSDLNDDGTLDVGYRGYMDDPTGNPKPIDYYGYYDSYKCYSYSGSGNTGLFTPVSVTANKKCNGQWSGDFLNYVTTSRMDALRKVLYGGYREVDTTTQTILRRVFIPQDLHVWGKEYKSKARDGYDIADYTPLSQPAASKYHLFANVTLNSVNDPPLMRIASNTAYRIWEWIMIERPVAGSQCATGNNSRASCVTGTGGNYDSHPNNNAEFTALFTEFGDAAHFQCSQAVDRINGNANPCAGADQDYFLDRFTGTMTVQTERDYEFAVDGDDAVEVIIDGVPIAGWYGGHGNCNCQTYKGAVHLTAGDHTIEFRHQERTGGNSWKLFWRSNNAGTWTNWISDPTVAASNTTFNLTQSFYNVMRTSAGAMNDYTVRVEVCKGTVGGVDFNDPNCQSYVSAAGTTVFKPEGLLQNYGKNNGMYFGLMTGSYTNNLRGGVLRRKISSINTEINSDGTINSSVNGIISTINRLRIAKYSYSSNSYGRVPNVTRMYNNDPDQNDWGNPLGEIIYESLRYFSGAGAATSTYTYTSSGSIDEGLGLALESNWGDPYGSTGSGLAYPYCSKPYLLMVSDVYPSFDSDDLPGAYFNPMQNNSPDPQSSGFSGTLTAQNSVALNVNNIGQMIWNNELCGASATSATGTMCSANIFVGESGATSDGAPTPKSASSFGSIRGLAPAEPTRQGSYSSAAVSYFGHVNDLNPASGQQRISTYAVALSSPLPKIEIPNANGKVTILPFAKSVTGGGIGTYKPTDRYTGFYIDTIRNTSPQCTSATPQAPNDCESGINGGRPYYKFRVSYEDSESGSDSDMDAITLYEVLQNADGSITVNLSSDYAAGGVVQHMGYVISGTTADGTYLEVRDSDTAQGSDIDFALDTPPVGYRVGGVKGLPLTATRTFTPSSTSSAKLLNNPLWYTAKWAGFVDLNGSNLPDSAAKWDVDNNGVPDNYFQVVNPLKLEEQLSNAFVKISKDSGTYSAVATNSTSLRSNQTVYQAIFSSDGWGGGLYAIPVNLDTSFGSVTWQAEQVMLTNLNPATRLVLTYDPDASQKGIPFRWASMTSNGVLQNSLNTMWSSSGGTVDVKGSSRVDYFRGSNVSGMRTRPCIVGTSGTSCQTNYLGDIINSAIQYVGPPISGLAGTSYKDFYTQFKARTPMLYVGANDGMLHGFEANTGIERIAYVPSALYSGAKLSKLTAPDYGSTSSSNNPHAFYVDGTPRIADVCSGSCSSVGDWKTILVGGLNGGGQGIYALDVTDPTKFTEANASSLVLWEFSDRDDADLGYTFSRPVIAPLCTQRDATSTSNLKPCLASRWVVMFGNGYNNDLADGHASTSNYAHLFIVDALTGTLLKKISTNQASTLNGLGKIAPVDLDGDGIVDLTYAPDITGNMWKFDLTELSATGATSLAYRLYQAQDSAGVKQPITSEPEVYAHPLGGTIVIFGTGKYLEISDPINSQQQTVYGIWDNGAPVTTFTDRHNLLAQSAYSNNTVSNGVTNYQASSNNPMNWSTYAGWYYNFPSTGSGTPSERVLFDPVVIGGLLFVTSAIPSSDVCSKGGSSWTTVLNPVTGGGVTSQVFYGAPQVSVPGITSSLFANRRESTEGIGTSPTVVSTGNGQGILVQGTTGGGGGASNCTGSGCPTPCTGPNCPVQPNKCFSTGASGTNIYCYGVLIKFGLGRRLSWREMETD